MKQIQLIESILPTAQRIWPELDAALNEMPPTECRRKTSCCALLPQMTLLEAARLVWCINRFSEQDRYDVFRRLIAYFHLNAAKITACPFLSHNECLVYTRRPFGCRAYGLWSPGFYRRQSEAAVESKRAVQRAWASMGVSLPRNVVEHRLPYCADVKVPGDRDMEDGQIMAIQKGIRELDRRLEPQSNVFAQQFFSDLSFLLAASWWGMDTCLKNKVAVVREYLNKGRSSSLEYLETGIPNLLSDGDPLRD